MISAVIVTSFGGETATWELPEQHDALMARIPQWREQFDDTASFDNLRRMVLEALAHAAAGRAEGMLLSVAWTDTPSLATAWHRIERPRRGWWRRR